MFIRVLLLAATAIVTSAATIAAGSPGVQLAQANTAQTQLKERAPKQMNKADFIKTIDARFQAIDTNKDGSLTKAEIAAAQAKILQQAQAAQQQRLESEFKKLDTNKDNQLNLAEFKAAAPPLRGSEASDQAVAQLDTNKDGKVSVQEYRAGPLASFDKTDSNRDGIVTAEELRAARRH